MKNKCFLLLPIIFISLAANADQGVTHQHGARTHTHVLPKESGLLHKHSSQVTKSSAGTLKHYHGSKSHSHPLPVHGYAHRHGSGDFGTEKQPPAEAVKKEVVKVTKSTEAPTSPSITVRFKCSDITRRSAKILLDAGHGYLDRDNDGDPCEPHNFPEQKPFPSSTTSTSSASSSNCHWVSGYTRKNGTRVRGHSRCR